MDICLKKDRDFAVFSGHPWIYREAVKETAPLAAGQGVKVFSHRGQFLGIGLIDPDSPIYIRVLGGSIESDSAISAIERNVKQAVALRRRLFPPGQTNAYRLINGEGDGLGGLVADRFAAALSLQTYSTAWEPHLPALVEILRRELPDLRWIYRRNQVRKTTSGSEGLIFGKGFSGKVRFAENGLSFEADLAQGQKTGFFLDQRDNRQLIRSLAKGRTVANICGYTGAFSAYALAGGAKRVVTVDSAGPALQQAEVNLTLNGFSARENPMVQDDMLEFLTREKPGHFDLIILDPPSMAKSRKDVPKALATYRKLNQAGLAPLAPGGMLFTASCSSQVGREDFLKTVQEASRKAGKRLKLLAETHHAPDHPIAFGHPEGRYLHALLLEVVQG